MARKQIRFGIIGLGLMGKEFASAVARWCHLLDDGPVPVITGICNRSDQQAREWFQDNFPTIEVVTDDYRELIASDKIDAVYCAVPHDLHEELYTAIMKSGKHLLGEKPFGIDKEANANILSVAEQHPELVVRCCSEFPYWPGAKQVIDWIREKQYGDLIEVKAGLLHSSDMDLQKAINWKRMIEKNGEYGCMGDLGFHTQHIPFRMGWFPHSVYGELQNIVKSRPDKEGNVVPCKTWDNATLMCTCKDPDTDNNFAMTLETKRMAPGCTNTWFVEVYGTKGSIKFSTSEPRSVYFLETAGKQQGWTRVDIGPKSFLPSVTGGIFEAGFSDTMQQMIGAFMQEFREDGWQHPFPTATLEETRLSHKLMTAALNSNEKGEAVTPE